jgi:putative acetyltransferase
VADCGVSVHPDYWNQGVGSALIGTVVDLADNWLNIERIELDVFFDNAAAIRVYEKFGFEIEGTKRKYAFREGEYVDTHVMARVKN